MYQNHITGPTPRPKTLLPSNLHPQPPTIAFNAHVQAIVDGGGCAFEGSSVLGRGVNNMMTHSHVLFYYFGGIEYSFFHCMRRVKI